MQRLSGKELQKFIQRGGGMVIREYLDPSSLSKVVIVQEGREQFCYSKAEYDSINVDKDISQFLKDHPSLNPEAKK